VVAKRTERLRLGIIDHLDGTVQALRQELLHWEGPKPEIDREHDLAGAIYTTSDRDPNFQGFLTNRRSRRHDIAFNCVD
jgi:hypothetical protein